MRPRVKICGLTRPEDARLASELGADFCGVIFYTESPRYVQEEKASAMITVIPRGKRVAVEVNPAPGVLQKRRAVGFDFFQVHYDVRETPDQVLRGWSDEVGADRLWLAPRVPPGFAFPAAALSAAETLLVDTFQQGTYGGSGRAGDWPHFRSLRERHPDHRWVLSGGLRPENIRPALSATGAEIVDVNSGVESAPGIKDAIKLDLLFAQLAEG
jgi:phosphoribosylanthranilate isomerase